MERPPATKDTRSDCRAFRNSEVWQQLQKSHSLHERASSFAAASAAAVDAVGNSRTPCDGGVVGLFVRANFCTAISSGRRHTHAGPPAAFPLAVAFTNKRVMSIFICVTY
eukprot:TRINITY_DN24443_c0_g1_i5.p1 TRINITY_DN24443_c0_g1~~TRINITY_DN24443_c0_g1_i5.p1  ORF type:complete len:110 (-),score=9.74 TRINITY_DN24443_c0_g1_i5:12-341(-)